jgi:lipopolysaccharide export system permease protein
MLILPKYVVKEHFGPFVFALSAITAMFIMNLLFRDLAKFLSKGIPIPIIAEFLFLNLAWMIALAVPMAVLCATLMVFGRMSSDHEITAIKASGVSLYGIVGVMLIVASILACGLIWFNNNVLPDFNHRARLLGLDIARKKPMINLNPGVLYTDIPNLSILVESVEDRDSVSVLENITIDDRSNSNIVKTIVARRGTVKFNDQTGYLEFTLYDGEAHEIDVETSETFKRIEFPKHILNAGMAEVLLKRSSSGYRGDREKSAQDLMENVEKNREKIITKNEQVAERVKKGIEAYLLVNGQFKGKEFDTVLQEHKQIRRQIETDIRMIENYRKQVNVNLVEVHKKYSIPAACLVFVLVGAPLGIRIRQGGWAVAGVLSLVFFLIYWAFLIAGESLADREIISPWLSMWSANIVVGLLGLIMGVVVIGEKRL